MLIFVIVSYSIETTDVVLTFVCLLMDTLTTIVMLAVYVCSCLMLILAAVCPGLSRLSLFLFIFNTIYNTYNIVYNT